MTTFIETKRLILKTPELSDLDNLVVLRTDFEVMKYTGEGGCQTKEQIKEYLDFAISYFNKHGMGFCLVFEKESGEFIGEAGVFHLLFDDTQPDIELDYHLHQKFWGKGFATELAKALIQWAFQHLSTSKLVSATYPDNAASQKVLEKAGFDYIGKKRLPDGKELFWYEIYKANSMDHTPQKPAIIFLTGASGAGKSTLLNAFNNEVSNNTTTCFHFDDIGVPSESDMIKKYGSGSEWQKAMTYHWVKKIMTEYKDKELVILEGQVNLDFITDAFAGFNFTQYKIILVHCDNKTRHQRLHQDRNQPELVNDQMDNWAEFLKKQAINKNAMILDTSLMNTEEMVNQFKKYLTERIKYTG